MMTLSNTCDICNASKCSKHFRAFIIFMCVVRFLLPVSTCGFKYLQRLAKLRRHASRVQFTKIHFGKINFGEIHFWKIHWKVKQLSSTHLSCNIRQCEMSSLWRLSDLRWNQKSITFAAKCHHAELQNLFADLKELVNFGNDDGDDDNADDDKKKEEVWLNIWCGMCGFCST